MAKPFAKKIFKVLLWIVGSLLVLDLTLVGLLFVPSIQNALVSFVTTKVSDAWQSEISIDNIYITPTLKVKAKGVKIMDMRHKEMIVVDGLSGRLNSVKLSPFELRFNVIEADNAQVILKKYKGSDRVNIAEWAQKFKKETPGKGFIFESKKLKLNHSYFVYENEEQRVHQKDSIIDYAFFELSDINFDSRDFLVKNSDISADIRKLAFTQYSGFNLLNASGQFRINSTGLTFDSLTLVTESSRIFMDFGFHYSDWSSYGAFVDSVRFKATVRPSVIQLSDVACFVPSIKGMNNSFIVSAQVDGPVNALELNNLNAYYQDNTALYGRLGIYNIADKEKDLRFDANIKNSVVNLSEMTDFLLPQGKKIPLPPMVTTLGNTRFNFAYQGSFSDFDAKVLLNSALGNMDAAFTLHDKTESYAYEGYVKSDGFNLGKLLNQNDLLGKIVLNTDFSGTALPKEKTQNFLASATAKLNGHIQSVQVAHYPLRDINIKANYNRQQADASILCADTNCQFDFNGTANWRGEEPNIQALFTLNNLAPGNIVEHYPQVDSSTTQTFKKLIYYAQQNPTFNLKINSLGIKLRGDDLDNVNGFVQIDSFYCKNNDQKFDIQRLRLVAINSERAGHQMIMTSNIANASLRTDYSLHSVGDVLKDWCNQYISQLMPEKSVNQPLLADKKRNENHQLTFNLETYQMREALAMFLPNWFISPRSIAYLQINSNNYDDSLMVSSDRISINRKILLRDIEVSGSEQVDGSFDIHSRCDTFKINQKDGNLAFKHIKINANILDNKVRYDLQWLNPEIISDYESQLAGEVSLISRDHILAQFEPSNIYLRDKAWHFGEKNAVHIMGKAFKFENVALFTERSRIKIDGSYSDDMSDSLTIDIKNLDLSLLNSYLQKSGMTFQGDVSSKLNLVVMGKSRAYTGRVMISDFAFNDEYFGNVFLLAYLPTEGDVFFTGGISKSDTTINSALIENYDYASFQTESNKLAKLNGYYNTEEKVFKVFAKIDTLHIGFLSPFLASFSNSVRGHASGDLSFIARPDTFYFDGKVNVQDAFLKIAVLNTEYHLQNQEITFDKQGINFEDIHFTDKYNNSGTLQGYVHHHKFKDFKINLDIETPNILVLNTTKTEDTPFYGDGFVSGNISITGDTKTLYFKGNNLRTEKGTLVHLPVSFADRTSESDVIHFKVDPAKLITMEKTETKSSSTEMVFEFPFDITPSAVVQLDLDLAAFRGTLRANAEGSLRLTYDSKNSLNLYGNAVLTSGSFLMNIEDLINKHFSLVEGGQVIFNGPLDNMTINASAVYSTTASLSDLISSEMTNASLRRLPVKAYLNLTGKFMQNPGVGFSFELPNSTTELSSLFYSAIDTTNSQNMIEQFFSLLMLGRFQANKEIATSTTNNGSDLSNNGINLLTSTVSSFLSKQFNNFNINLNYRNADVDHAAEYSVATSTSLFNNRTVIESNLGYADDKYNSGNSTTFIGDFSIEQKLNESGTWRVKVFNVTNQYNQLTSTTPYAQGVALIYKQDFNSGKDIADSFKPKKKNKKKNTKDSIPNKNK